jgi:hypothetical protein
MQSSPTDGRRCVTTRAPIRPRAAATRRRIRHLGLTTFRQINNWSNRGIGRRYLRSIYYFVYHTLVPTAFVVSVCTEYYTRLNYCNRRLYNVHAHCITLSRIYRLCDDRHWVNVKTVQRYRIVVESTYGPMSHDIYI